MNFEVNQAQYKEDETLRLETLRSQEPPDFIQRESKIYDLCRQLSCRPEQLFLSTFGEEQIIKQYTVKNWIWTFSGRRTKAVLLALVNENGIYWEYDSDDGAPAKSHWSLQKLVSNELLKYNPLKS